MVALALMKKRQQKTLIIVHTTILLDQWIKRLKTYFNLTDEDLGIIGNNKWRVGKKVTIASYMTLTRRGLDDVKNKFGLIIIDECHHVPANTFSEVVKQFSAKFVLGLTATAYRKDKLEKLMHLYVSDTIISVAEEVKETEDMQESLSIETQLITRKTAFTVAHKTDEFQELGKFLIADQKRNGQIATDIAEVLSTGAKCIVLTERIEHCETLLALVREKIKNIHAAIATGNMTKKNRERIAKRMMQERFQLLIATGKLIGEGFDWPAVSHIFFAFPFSWKGKLIQYVGRVQRPFEGKTIAMIHDYFDDQVPMLKLMYFKRLRTYRSLGLTKITSPTAKKKQIDENQQSLFST
jgi:superfamily II DNA or RNA helicase